MTIGRLAYSGEVFSDEGQVSASSIEDGLDEDSLEDDPFEEGRGFAGSSNDPTL